MCTDDYGVHEDRDPSGGAGRRERDLIAVAREQAAQARARAAAAQGPRDAGLLRHGWPEEADGDRMSPWRDLLPGYELKREIARGQQGVVYQALQRSTRRQVAIKVMRERPFAGFDDKARFEHEVRILGQLDHPSIVAIHDSGVAAGCFYFVMNYVAGPTLDAYVRDGELTVGETLDLFAGICEAVNAAHLRGIIHRDLKPSNIRIDASGRAHVLDFGLAKAEEGSLAPGASVVPAMTLTGQFIGSLPWASPEQVSGDGRGLDVRSDVYSLGVVLYQMLTGTFPYDVHGRLMDVVQGILHAEPISPRAAIEPSSGWSWMPGRRSRRAGSRWIDGEVETIVLKCLSKDRARRYQSAGELARDVRHHLAGEAIEARRDSLGYLLKKHVRRHRLPFALAALLLLALVTGLAVSLAFWGRSLTARAALADALDRATASERATRQVADAQAKMLSDVDPNILGARLREDVLGEARAAMERSGAGGDDVAARLAQLEALLAGTNFTNVGARSIDRNMLAPAIASIDRDFGGDPLVQASLWMSVAQVYWQLGMYDAAVPLVEQSLAARRRLLGDDDPDTLESINRLSKLLYGAGREAEAEAYTREALETGRRLLGDDHPATLAAMADMSGFLHYRHRDSAAAEALARETLETQRRVLGDDHPDTLWSIHRLGTLFLDQSKLSEAEPYVREALQRTRRVLGEDHGATLESIFAMGGLLMFQGKLSEAEPYVREALEWRQRVLGDEHPDTVLAIVGMAMLRGRQDRWDEVEQLHQKALDIRRRTRGEDHPQTISSLGAVGSAIWRQHRPAEAEPYLREALARYRRVLGEDHARTLGAIGGLQTFLTREGKLAEADELGAYALRRARRASPPVDRTIGRFLVKHAETLVALNRFGEAEAELNEAMELLATAGNPKHDGDTLPIDLFVRLYEAWDAVEPFQGHDVEAAEWRAKRDEGR